MKTSKNFEKSLKKGLTKGKRCGKIERSLSESRRRRSLKIEQQKFRTRKKCEGISLNNNNLSTVQKTILLISSKSKFES